MDKVSLASDNNSGVSPEVIQAMQDANTGYAVGYGDDAWTEKAKQLFQDEFGKDTTVLFVLTGTGANVLAVKTLLQSFHSLICPESAHINEDEAGGPEATAGTKILPVKTEDGKLRPDDITPFLGVKGFVHASQPAMISISQVTENGTVYSLDEIRTLCGTAHEHGLLVHMDGARLANAAVALGKGLREITRDAGVDVLSFGGTKNGLLMGEAVLFFGHENAPFAENFRKQNAQLFSKMRFIAAQFIAYFEQGLWKQNAAHANAMAQKLGRSLQDVNGVEIVREVEANSVFATIPADIIPQVQEEFFFYIWNRDRNEVRLMTSFQTKEDEVHQFTEFLRKKLCEAGYN